MAEPTAAAAAGVRGGPATATPSASAATAARPRTCPASTPGTATASASGAAAAAQNTPGDDCTFLVTRVIVRLGLEEKCIIRDEEVYEIPPHWIHKFLASKSPTFPRKSSYHLKDSVFISAATPSPRPRTAGGYWRPSTSTTATSSQPGKLIPLPATSYRGFTFY